MVKGLEQMVPEASGTTSSDPSPSFEGSSPISATNKFPKSSIQPRIIRDIKKAGAGNAMVTKGSMHRLLV